MKIVINKCFGGFSLSQKAYEFLVHEWDGFGHGEWERNDPKLVQCVEQLGKAADGLYAELKVVEIPDDVDWGIDDYDGMESISENHRVWS